MNLLRAGLRGCVVVIALVLMVASTEAQTNLRAWHADGQTFVVWQHGTAMPPARYDVFASATPIRRLTDAIWIGRVCADNGANARLHLYTKMTNFILGNL